MKKNLKNWIELIEFEEKRLRNELSDIQISALVSWVQDCQESFEEIYSKNLQKLKIKEINTKDDYDQYLEQVTDIYFELQHIKSHIKDAEKGFQILMDILAKKAE